MFKVEAVVIGAGVVGLAIARALAMSGREVLILESDRIIGSGTSSRNSEVIHAGLYYPTGSLKAKLCVAGRDALYEYCAAHGVGHRRCGKLVVATSEAERAYLEKLQGQAHANGVDDTRLIEAAELHAMEPALTGELALLSPSTGIIDSHGLMLAYQGDAEDAGAMLAFRAPVIEGAFSGAAVQLRTGGEEASELEADLVVNAAGLGAWDVSRSLAGLDPARVPPKHLAKGNYFTLTGRAPFQRLIYPVPEPGGLGVHLTLDLGGQARFGPDVEWIEEPHYDVDPRRGDGFYAAIRRYWPGLPDGALAPGYSGIRPKTSGPGEPASDFVVQGPAETGHPGYIALYGMESPGLTSSLAIGDMVLALAASA